MSNQPEGTFERLRYSLGGNRPSQTAHLTMSQYLIKAMVRNPATPAWYPTDGSVYSERITVDVPDIPWYYKIAEEYVGTFEPDANTASQGATAYENHVVKVELSDDLSTITFYDIDPYVQEAAGTSYVSGRMNYITGELDLDARTVTFTVTGYGADINASPYLLSPISDYSSDGYGLADASEIQLPWIALFDNEAGNLPFVYSENGITLSAN